MLLTHARARLDLDGAHLHTRQRRGSALMTNERTSERASDAMRCQGQHDAHTLDVESELYVLLVDHATDRLFDAQ